MIHQNIKTLLRSLTNAKMRLRFRKAERHVKQYLESRRDKIFSDVGVLIFVVEAENYDNRNTDDHIEDITYFEK